VGEAWELMVDSLVKRGFPRHDAEDVVQEVFIGIIRNPQEYFDKLTHLEDNKGWFITLAMNRYLMLLRGNRRRRQREHCYCMLSADPDDEVLQRIPGAETILVLAEQAQLTNRQRGYLRAVVVDRLTIDDIAEVTNTTPRAVRAVLQRAVQRLRHHLLVDITY